MKPNVREALEMLVVFLACVVVATAVVVLFGGCAAAPPRHDFGDTPLSLIAPAVPEAVSTASEAFLGAPCDPSDVPVDVVPDDTLERLCDVPAAQRIAGCFCTHHGHLGGIALSDRDAILGMADWYLTHESVHYCAWLIDSDADGKHERAELWQPGDSMLYRAWELQHQPEP